MTKLPKNEEAYLLQETPKQHRTKPAAAENETVNLSKFSYDAEDAKLRISTEYMKFIKQSAWLAIIVMLLVVPISLGAVIGEWLDQNSSEFKLNYRICFISAGVLIGVVTAYWLCKNKE